jgi:hypothetical protein
MASTTSFKNMKTRLTKPESFKSENMVFANVQSNNIPDSKIKYKRINIYAKNPDGSVGELLIPSPKLFSWGLSQNVSSVTNEPIGYTQPMVLWSMEGPTPAEKQFTKCIEQIIEATKVHLLQDSVRTELELYDLTVRELKNIFTSFYWKLDKGERVPGVSPTLYIKLMINRKENNAIKTKYYNAAREVIDPYPYMDTRCDVTGIIKFDSIYVSGSKVSIQASLKECLLEPKEVEKSSYLWEDDVAEEEEGEEEEEEEEEEVVEGGGGGGVAAADAGAVVAVASRKPTKTLFDDFADEATSMPSGDVGNDAAAAAEVLKKTRMASARAPRKARPAAVAT